MPIKLVNGRTPLKERYRMYVIDQHNIAAGDDRFIITIDTTKGTGNSFVLPLKSGYTHNFSIDWGDGNISEITAYNDGDITHNYASGGVYQLKMTGKVGSWSFNNLGDKLKLISIDNWGAVLFDYLESAFNGCSNLLTMPATGSISYSGGWTKINSTFLNCSKLTNLSESLLANMAALTEASSAFNGCIALTSLPPGLFVPCSNLVSYRNTFFNCRNMALPAVLFDLNTMSGNADFYRFMRTSATAYSNTGAIQDVWNYTSVTGAEAFLNQTSLTNYASIPAGWK